MKTPAMACGERFRCGNLDVIEFLKTGIAEFILCGEIEIASPEPVLSLTTRFFAELRTTRSKGLAMTSEVSAQEKEFTTQDSSTINPFQHAPF
jgi:hypothetical protein